MKLIRCGPEGHEIPGVLLDDGGRFDVSAFARDYDEAFSERAFQLERGGQWVKTSSAPARPPASVSG